MSATKTKDPRQVLGREGEDAAVEYLKRKGFTILDRNWRCADGELDIVAVDPRHVFVAVEVKTRTGTRFGTPLEAVGHKKLRRLRKLTVIWLNAHGIRYDRIRIDVVAITRDDKGEFTIQHEQAVG
jgi:Holliday junction resolvase-like predicted endonuclease